MKFSIQEIFGNKGCSIDDVYIVHTDTEDFTFKTEVKEDGQRDLAYLKMLDKFGSCIVYSWNIIDKNTIELWIWEK